MSDSNQTIKKQINDFTAMHGLAALGLVLLGDIIGGLLVPLTDADARTVTTHVLVMDVPGRIESVLVTAGGVTGIFTKGPAGATPATTQCAIAYDVNGIATITFAAADAVTAAKVQYTAMPYTTNMDGTKGLGNLLAMTPT